MKNLKILGGIVLCLISLQLTAQVKAPLNELVDKPLLFTDFPQKCSISKPAVEKLFAGSATGSVKIPLENNRLLEGVIVEKQQKSSALTSINIRLSHYEQALFTVSKLTAENGTISYTGRIVHISFGDVLILKQENQELYFVKEKQSLFLVE